MRYAAVPPFSNPCPGRLDGGGYTRKRRQQVRLYLFAVIPYSRPDRLRRKNLRTTLVQSLQSVSLLDSNFTSSAALGLENWTGRGTGRLFVEAGENGQELEVRFILLIN